MEAGRPWAGLQPLEPRLLLSTVTVTFDYRFDDPANGGQGFFEVQARRDRLQEAADRLVAHFTDTLAAIEPTDGNTWTATFLNPADGSNATLTDLTIAENEILIFAGGRSLGEPLGVGGAGGWSASGSSSFLDTVQARGQSGALQDPATDFGPWGGMVSFDTETNWHFGATTDGLDSDEFDFLSVALHEMLHVLGFSSGVGAFGALVDSSSSPAIFEGAQATAEYDGAGQPSLASDLSHWAHGVADDGQTTLMAASTSAGIRTGETRLDRAVLSDIGWDMDLQAPTADFSATDVHVPTAYHEFTVTYSDNSALDVTTIEQNDQAVRVLGPNGFDELSSWVNIDQGTDGTPRTATYRVAAPGGEWGPEDSGTYTVRVMGETIADGSSNYLEEAELGAFLVRVSDGPDLNNDGHADVVWRNQATGQNGVWIMNGTSKTRWQGFESVGDTQWHMEGLADFNGDAQTDILWRNYTTGQNLLWTLNGTSKTGWQGLETVGDTDWRIGGVADFNGDGQTDVLWRNSVTGQNGLWAMDGTTKLGWTGLETVGDPDWRIAGAADFSGDGQADILWRNYATGQNLVWVMNGTSKSGWTSLEAVGDTDWHMVGLADMNGGGTDILWRNQTTGQNLVWVMDGMVKENWASFEAVANTDWRVAGSDVSPTAAETSFTVSAFRPSTIAALVPSTDEQSTAVSHTWLDLDAKATPTSASPDGPHSARGLSTSASYLSLTADQSSSTVHSERADHTFPSLARHAWPVDLWRSTDMDRPVRSAHELLADLSRAQPVVELLEALSQLEQ